MRTENLPLDIVVSEPSVNLDKHSGHDFLNKENMCVEKTLEVWEIVLYFSQLENLKDELLSKPFKMDR
jgi:hypothetical protein